MQVTTITTTLTITTIVHLYPTPITSGRVQLLGLDGQTVGKLFMFSHDNHYWA